MIKISELTDKQLVGMYKNCKKSTKTCDGCHAFGMQRCVTVVKEEMCRRFMRVVEDRR